MAHLNRIPGNKPRSVKPLGQAGAAVVVAAILSLSGGAWGLDSYHFRGRQIVLQRESSLVGVDFGPEVDVSSVRTFISSDGEVSIDEIIAKTPRRGRFVCRIKEKPDARPPGRVRASLAADKRVLRTYPVFRNPKSGMLVYVFDELAVRLRPGIGRDQLARFSAARGVEIVEQNRYDPAIFLLRVSAEGQSCLDVANEYVHSGLCLWAEPNFGGEVRKASVNDPFYPNQWHLNNTGQNGGTADADVDAPEAWAITTGSPAVVIAVLDDGIDMPHEDLAAHIYVNPGESGGGRETNGVDDDGNGYIDDVHGWDFYDNDNNTDHALRIGALEGHGTSVAGIAAAVGNNATGVSGIAYSCTILPIKVFRGEDFAGNYEVGNAIRYASTLADVLSNSWGGAVPSELLYSAIFHAVENGRGGLGCPVIVASGNESLPVVFHPADSIWAVAVGATDPTDMRFSYSNYGPRLTLVSPSGNWTTDITGVGAGYDDGDPTGNYTGAFGGTSSATPLASGVAALLLSLNPNLTALQVQCVLQSTADKVSGIDADYDAFGFSLEYGYGRLNAHSAVLEVQQGQATDDPFEENDTRAGAAPIDKGFYSALAALDDDWYAIDVEPYQDISADIHFIHERGNLQLGLYDNQGTLVNDSTSTTDTEHVEANVGNTASPWYFRVFGEGGATNFYHLFVSKRPPDDSFEPNDTVDTATPITPGSYDGLRGFDPDYYKISVGAGEKITAVIRFPGELGDLDLYLVEYDNTILSVSDSYVADVEGVWYHNTGPTTTLYILVDNYQGAENTYRLEVVVGPGADDEFENNDSQLTAKALEPGIYGGLQGYDEDWFKVTVGPERVLETDIRFLHAVGDLDLELISATGAVLDVSDDTADYERVVWVNSGATSAVVYPHVYPFGWDYPDYTLSIAVSDLTEDTFEENDDSDHATPIPVGLGTLGDLVLYDEDYFAVNVYQGQTIAALLAPEGTAASLEMNLYSPAGAPLDATPAGQLSLILFRQAPTTGTYTLRVGSGSPPAVALYGIGTFVYNEATTGPKDDAFEPNDIRATEAKFIIPGAYPGLVCADRDYYSIPLVENDSLHVAIAFDRRKANLDLALTDLWGQNLAVSRGSSDQELAVIERAPYTGTYYIHVYRYDGLGTARYDLLISRWPRGMIRRDLLGARHWTLY